MMYRPALNKSPFARHALDLYMAYAGVTAFWVATDITTLDNLASSVFNDDRRAPDLVSPSLLCPLHALIRRDDSRHLLGQGIDAEHDWARNDDATELVDRFQTSYGGSIQSLTKLVTAQIALTPRFPKLADSIVYPCHMVSDILRETYRQHASNNGQPQLIVEQARQRLRLGHAFYNLVSPALLNAIEKHVTQLTNDGAVGQIHALTDIYQFSLEGDHRLAQETLRQHRQEYPKLPHRYTAEAVAWEWRFNMLGKLITSSQMQLRVAAVTGMCSDLVGFWKRFQDVIPEDRHNPLLNYFAEYLMRTRLVEYILGPGCHPEITVEAANIVGFLLVTKFYQPEHSDLLWQTITTSQDPRVVDAVIRMTVQISNLHDIESTLYLCGKVHSLPIASFSAAIRGLCDSLFKNYIQKCQNELSVPSFLPYNLCLRLLRESSVCGPQIQVAYPEIQNWAMLKFRDLLAHGPDMDGRRELYLSCIRDIASKSPTTLGSIWALSMAVRSHLPMELHTLTHDHDLTRLLVDELEHAIAAGREARVPAVLATTTNAPRREFFLGILMYESQTITPELGTRLWDMLVGRDAACDEDRLSGWGIVNNAVKKVGLNNNPMLSACFTRHLPNLPSDCFCEGALEFIKEGILPRVNDMNDIILDDTESMAKSGIEQLWRIILTATDQVIADTSIQILVSGIYIDSKSIMAYPHHRARQVHLALVNRCLRQLDEAAKRLKSFSDGTVSGSDGTMSGDDEPMVIVATDGQIKDQERVFVRSLTVLRQFLQAHQLKARFAAPDLRSLMPRSPNLVEGESAELKYQSFDGSTHTEVKPLNISNRSTAASLLASLREVTGFENYRIYYKGQAFIPNENDICKSLKDLRIENGLILVKRETEGVAPSPRIKPGASPLEIEILSHFDELWGYLSMEDRLANEVRTARSRGQH